LNTRLEQLKELAEDDVDLCLEDSRYRRLSEAERLAILKYALDNNDYFYSANFSNFRLKPLSLFQLAKHAAALDAWDVSIYLEAFQLQTEEERFQVAKIAAGQNGGKFSLLLERYEIKDPELLYQLAKVAVLSDAEGTLRSLANYSLSVEEQKELFILAFVQTPVVAKREEKEALLTILEEMVEKSEVLNETGFMERLFSMYLGKARRALLYDLYRYQEWLDFDQLKAPYDVSLQLLAHFGEPALLEKVRSKDLKYGPFVQQFILTVHDLLLETELRDDFSPLMSQVLEGTSRTKKRERLMALSLTLSLYEVDLLKAVARGEKAFDETIGEAFSKGFGMEAIPQFRERYAASFGTFRDSRALATYYAKMRTLLGEERKDTLEALRLYIAEVLDGTFHEKRYENSSHLARLFFEREELKRLWMEGASEEVELTQERVEGNVDYAALLDSKLQDGHLPLEMSASVKEQLQAVREEGKDALVQLRSALEKLKPSPELLHDVKGWIRFEESGMVLSGKFLLVDTDDPCDLLLMGTEVEGSCQRVDADTDFGKGLVGTLLDGKIRLLALKDREDGKIVARLLIRLMEVKGEAIPALLMEPIYPDITDPRVKELLLDFAERRAEALGLPLYKAGEERGWTLISRGSRAPFEYVDSTRDVEKWGLFTVSV